MGVIGHSGESSDEMILETALNKGDPCYEVAKNLAELCSCSGVLRKVELGSEAKKMNSPLESPERNTALVTSWW